MCHYSYKIFLNIEQEENLHQNINYRLTLSPFNLLHSPLGTTPPNN